MTTRQTPGRTDHSPTIGWQYIAGASAALTFGALGFILRPLLTTSLVVSLLGGVAALFALVALAAIVRLVVTDVWTDVRKTRGRSAPSRPDASASLARHMGRELAVYHATRRAR